MSNEIANQFSSQSLGELKAISIKTVGSRVFPDPLSVGGMNSLIAIVDAYRSTHAPINGNVIPDTSESVTGPPSGANVDIVSNASSTNTVSQVQAVSFENTGSGAISLELVLGATLLALISVPAGQKVATFADCQYPLFITGSEALSISVTSGDFNDLIVSCSLVKTVI